MCLLYKKGCEKDASKADEFKYFLLETCPIAHGCAVGSAEAVFAADVVGCKAKWREPGLVHAEQFCAKDDNREYDCCGEKGTSWSSVLCQIVALHVY